MPRLTVELQGAFGTSVCPIHSLTHSQAGAEYPLGAPLTQHQELRSLPPQLGTKGSALD